MLKKMIIALSAFLLLGGAAIAAEVSKEQIKGLDEQVQEIKSDVLNISAELNQLEEKLLYPAHTQMAVFVSLARGEKFRLDSVEIKLDGAAVAEHIYTFKELEALRRGGVQRIHTGNVRAGEHVMQVTMRGMAGNSAVEKSQSFKVTKEAGPKIVELTLAQQAMTMQER